MSDHHPPSTAGMPFTQDDWHEFHEEDIRAGRAVVVLMTAIFSLGVVLYTIVMSAVLM